MKIPCGVIEDLLPLYVDEICSQESKNMVEEHLKDCEYCQREYKKLKMPIGKENKNLDIERIARKANVILEKAEKDTTTKARNDKEFEINFEESKIIKRSFRKIKRRWLISLLVVALILPACGLAYLGVNQYQGEGLCFTNLDETYTVMKFIKYIKAGKYEQAVDMLESHYMAQYREIKQYEQDGLGEASDIFGSWAESQVIYEFDGITWYRNPRLEDYHHYLHEEAEIFWEYVIQNQVKVMIPQESWNQVVGENYMTSEMEDITLYYPFMDYVDEDSMTGAYQLITTEVGEYYVPYFGMDYRQCSTVELCLKFVMYPYELYLQGLEERKQLLEQDYEDFLDCYEDELAMTQEEYVEYCKAQAVEALLEYGEKTSLLSVSFEDAYYISEGDFWRIVIKLSEHYSGDSNVYKTNLDFPVINGKLSYPGGGYSNTVKEKYYDQTLISYISKVF